MSDVKCQILNKGFTLVELLVVIAVLGLIAGISLVAFMALSSSLRLENVARDLVTDLRYVQRSAVTEQLNYGVRFSSTTDEYQLLRYGTTTQEILGKLLPEGIDFQQISGFSNDEVIFNSYGAVTEAGEVSLINIEGKTRTIEVRPSGFVRLKK